MSAAGHVVLIHGTWARGDGWGPAQTAFEERGFTVHTPTLRHHELPLQEGALKIAPVSLRDYTDDLVALVDSLGSPPLVVGLSPGGLLALPVPWSAQPLPALLEAMRPAIAALRPSPAFAPYYAPDALAASLPEALLRVEAPPMADWLESFVPMRLHALVRFGLWEEIIATPLVRM